MIQQLTPAAHAAWDQFKQYMQDTGLLTFDSENSTTEERITQTLVQYAFKQGFATAQQDDRETPREVVPTQKLPIQLAIPFAPVNQSRPGIKRKVDFRQSRSHKQRVVENEALHEILKGTNKPMPLMAIIEQMHKAGFDHWNNNNASSFIRTAQSDGVPIVRIERGIYQLQKGDN